MSDDDLRAFREWRSSFEPTPDAHAYLSQHLDVSSAVLFAQLLSPELVLDRGCVILKDSYDPENFEHWWQTEGGDTVRIEAVINHLHLWDLFEPDGEEDQRALVSLAGLIATSWRRHASARFPHRTFRVEVTDDYGPTIVMTSVPLSPGWEDGDFSTEVPTESELELMGLDIEPGADVGVTTVTAWTHDQTPVHLTWDEIARSIGFRWTTAGNDVEVVREHVTRVGVTDEGPRVRFDVSTRSADLFGTLTVHVGQEITVRDTLLET